METGATTFHSIGTTTDWVVMVIYFIAVMLFGSYFGRYTKTTSDFFFGGRRFSWWLITMSIVATGVGSHSFVKYSGDIHISFLEPIMPGIDKNEFLNQLETKIYSEIEKFN